MAKQRKHGSGTVRLRSDGRWEGRVVIGYDDKGLPKTKNVLAKTKTECEKKLKSLIAAQKESEPELPQQTMTVAQWLDFWYQTYKKSNLRPNTQMSYERRIYQHIIPALGQIQLDKLTTGDIQKFYSNLKKGGRLLRAELYGEELSGQTVRGIHTTLHAALNKAVEEKLIFRNPTDGCKLPSAKSREMKVLTPEEIQAEAARLLQELRVSDTPNSPHGTHYMARVSPDFLARAGTQAHDQLMKLLPFRSLAITGLVDRPGTYVTILASEDRSKELRQPRRSVRRQLKQEPHPAEKPEKKAPARKKQEPER